jgi:E3 ubiquitin-protein ligase RHA2
MPSSLSYRRRQGQGQEEKAAETDSDCAFCLSAVRDGEEVRELRCHHFFHHACIDAWLVRPRATCPLCCDRLLPADVPLTSESGYNRLSSSASAYTHGGAIWWHMT